MLLEQKTEETPYITSIYVQFNYADKPTEALPYWLAEMLIGPNLAYHMLLKAANDLSNWGIYMDLIHYRNYDNEHRNLTSQHNILSGQLQ